VFVCDGQVRRLRGGEDAAGLQATSEVERFVWVLVFHALLGGAEARGAVVAVAQTFFGRLE
jgi:hypothetical protein